MIDLFLKIMLIRFALIKQIINFYRELIFKCLHSDVSNRINSYNSNYKILIIASNELVRGLLFNEIFPLVIICYMFELDE